MADTKKRKDAPSLMKKRKPRTNDESFDDDDFDDDGKISKATKISDEESKHHQVEQIVLKAKLESKARLKYAHAVDNELCEPKRDGPEVNFPTSKEEYEELRQRHSVAKQAAKTTTLKEEEEEKEKKDEDKTTKWVQSYDQTQEEFYYFNPQTRETRWEEPEETTIKIVRDESALAEHKKRALFASVSKEELEEIEREARGEIGGVDENGLKRSPPFPTGTSVVAANAPQMGWEYEDDSGNWQGPFQTEQLQMWRAALPMNLKVRQHGTTKKESECTSLALLLGDAHLRKRCEALGAVLPLRCTAVEAEQVMMAAIAARDRIAKENLNGLASDDGDEDDEGEDKKNNGIEKPNRWAQAALEGLPENDRIEQEKIAMENATGVRSSAHIDEGEDASERFASVGTYNRVTGRVTAEVNELLQRRRAAGPPGGAGAAYRNIGLENYIDPAKMDEAMREIQKARHQKLSRTEIDKRKARKKEMKKKHGDNWLREEWAD